MSSPSPNSPGRPLILFSSNDGEVRWTTRIEEPVDLPSRAIQNALHFIWRNEQVVHPGTDRCLIADAEANLASHSSSPAIQPLILKMVPVLRLLGITRTHNQLRIGRSNPAECL